MLNKKPRIAFCFSWQARTLNQTYLFFKKNFFDAAKEQWFDYDVFCAVEDDEDVDKVKLLNPTKVEKIKSSDVEKIIEKKYGDFINHEFSKKYCFMNYSPKALKNLLQQYYKIQKSFSLAKNYWEIYVITFRLRFDTIFLNKLNFLAIKEHIDNNIVICNRWSTKKSLSLLPIQDFYFIWNTNLVNTLAICFDNFESWFKWHEIKKQSKIVYKLFSLINKINVNTWYKINKITHAFAIFNSLFFKSYTSETTFHDYIIKSWFNLKKTNISLILLRKKTEDSFAYLKEKTCYEL